MTGDVFHSLRCDCGEQMEAALAAIEARGAGVFLYMRQEGRGHRPAQQAEGLRPAGRRQRHRRGQPAARLRRRPARLRHRRADPGTTSASSRMELLTNNPRKIVGLDSYGLEIVAPRAARDRAQRAQRPTTCETKKETARAPAGPGECAIARRSRAGGDATRQRRQHGTGIRGTVRRAGAEARARGVAVQRVLHARAARRRAGLPATARRARRRRGRRLGAGQFRDPARGAAPRRAAAATARSSASAA